MKAEDWTRLRPVLARLFELPEAEHDAHLDAACGDDADLRQRVLAAYRAERSDEAFLEPPERSAASEGPVYVSGKRVGKWRLLTPIGSGGMGTVWLAERTDGAFAMRAAVKLQTSSTFSKQHLKRFELEHPRSGQAMSGSFMTA